MHTLFQWEKANDRTNRKIKKSHIGLSSLGAMNLSTRIFQFLESRDDLRTIFLFHEPNQIIFVSL